MADGRSGPGGSCFRVDFPVAVVVEILSGPDRGKRIPLVDDLAHFGRGDDNTVVLSDAGIEAVVRKGDVRLIGRVKDLAQKNRAETIARGVNGVHSIHNELAVGG